MRFVSINSFLKIVFDGDDQPPAASTIRRHCSQFDEKGAPKVPGACKFGKVWKIDIDTYIHEMERRMAMRTDICEEDLEFLKRFIKKEY